MVAGAPAAAAHTVLPVQTDPDWLPSRKIARAMSPSRHAFSEGQARQDSWTVLGESGVECRQRQKSNAWNVWISSVRAYPPE